MNKTLLRTLVSGLTVAAVLFASAAPAVSVYADGGKDKKSAPAVKSGGGAGGGGQGGGGSSQGGGSSAKKSETKKAESSGGSTSRAAATTSTSSSRGGGNTARPSEPTISQNTEPDAGDNRHPSGKDRSVEPGGLPNGKSGSNPDENGKGPERTSSGGPDKPGHGGGVDKHDQDGNNGCGNDDDFEDDNEGWCGGKPKRIQAEQPKEQPKQDERPKHENNQPKDEKDQPKDEDKPKLDEKDHPKHEERPDQDGDQGKDDEKSDHKKVTVCHRTGSESNPFVMITIDEHAWEAHRANHGDTMSERCAEVKSETRSDNKQDKGPHFVIVCHRSSSMTWTLLTVNVEHLAAFQAQGDFVVPSGTSAEQCAPAVVSTSGGGSSSGGGGGNADVEVANIKICIPIGSSMSQWALVVVSPSQLADFISRGAFQAPLHMTAEQCAPASSGSAAPTGGAQASVPVAPEVPAVGGAMGVIPTALGPIELPAIQMPEEVARLIEALPLEEALEEVAGVLELPVALPMAGSVPLGGLLAGSALLSLLGGAALRRLLRDS